MQLRFVFLFTLPVMGQAVFRTIQGAYAYGSWSIPSPDPCIRGGAAIYAAKGTDISRDQGKPNTTETHRVTFSYYWIDSCVNKYIYYNATTPQGDVMISVKRSASEAIFSGDLQGTKRTYIGYNYDNPIVEYFPVTVYAMFTECAYDDTDSSVQMTSTDGYVSIVKNARILATNCTLDVNVIGSADVTSFSPETAKGILSDGDNMDYSVDKPNFSPPC